MKKFLVDYYETYTKSYEVEANSNEEAEQILLEGIREGLYDAPTNCDNCWCETELIEETASLIDGITSCCGYDFGTDMGKVNFCPICGKKLVK